MFNVWTFILEIINFLVLLWILKRLFYGPIVGVINRRRERVRGQMEELEAREAELAEERRRYEEQLRGLAGERERTLGQARAEAEEERRKIVERARQEALGEQEKLRAAFAEERRAVMRDAQQQVVEAAVAVAEQLLGAVAGRTLHDELVARGLSELEGLAAERLQELTRSLPTPQVAVVSARPLTAGQAKGFEEAVERALGRREGRVPLAVSEDAALLAGVRVEAGELVLDATLPGQLEPLRGRVRRALEGGEAEGGQG